MENSLTFITSNPAKASQLAKYLGFPVFHHQLELAEIQSTDSTEVITHKAQEAYQHLKGPVLVDDVSLTIHAMGKLPGPFIKYFLQELGTDRLCTITHSLSDNSATATVALGFSDGTHTKVFTGEITGSIADKSRGTGGFGWDVIFIPDGYTKTRGEMTEEEYDTTSPRKKALEKLEKYLKALP